MNLLRLVVALAASLSCTAHAADCAALLQQHRASDLALPFETFDQDDHQGWRALEASRARLAAAAEKSASNGPTLKAVDRLARCFGQPCKVAYSCPATS